MASPAAVLQILVTANSAQATTALARTDAQLKKTTASANTASSAMGTKLASAAKMGAAAVGATLVYGLYKAVSAGADFEKQMDSLGAVSNASAKEMSRLEKQALKLGQQTAFSASEAAEAQIELAKGGLKVKQILGGALPAALSLAAAGELELGDAASTTVNAMKLFGLQGRKAMEVADMLATAANRTTADVSDFAMALRQGGSVAKQAGYDLNQTITVLEALAEAGIKNSDAGTSMKTAFLQLLAPTEKQQTLMSKLNLDLIDSNGELKSAAGLSKQLQDALGGMTSAQRAANLKVLAGTDGFRTLSALYDAGPEKLNKLTQANNENGTANEIAKEKMDNLSGSLEQLSGAFETLAIRISKIINPAIRAAVDWLTGAVNALADIDLSNMARNDEDLRKFGDAMHNVGVAVKFAWEKFIEPVLKIMGPAVIEMLKGLAQGARGYVEVISGILTLDLRQAFDGVVDIVKGFGRFFLNQVKYTTAFVRVGFAKLGEVAVAAFRAPVMGVVKVVRFVFDKVMGAISSTLRVAASIAEKFDGVPIVGGMFDGLGEAATGAADKIDGFRKSLRGDDKEIKEEGKSLRDLAKIVKDTGGDVADFSAKVADKLGVVSDAFSKTTGKSGKMAKGVGRNVTSLANGVASGLEAIKDNLNKSLAAFQVKKVGYSVKKVGNVVGNVVGAQKGAIVGGTGSGDKVPLHIGGQLAAMVEPNELVSVTNRTATAALMAHNRRVPRRAQGGMVDPAGPGTGLVNEAIAGIVGRWSQRFNAAINYGYDPGGGHLSPGHNVTGTATDTGPAGGWGAGPTRLFEQGLKLLLGSGLTVLYGSHGIGTPYPNHGYGNHAHIEWGMHPVIKGLGAAAAETIKRILLKGPKGPLRDMGQSALDKTRKAASAYLAKHSGGMMGGDIGAPIRSLPEALQKYNRTYAEHNSAEGDWGGYRMPFNAVAALAEWAGAPGVSMARTAIGESNLRPGATGVDPGGTKGYGLWMITTSFNDDLVKPYGGYGQMLNPVLNAQVMNKILDRQGIGAWYSSTKDTSGTHYSGPLLRKHGGLVPHLAKGGKAGDKDLHGTATPGPVTNAFKRFRKARRIAKQLKDLLGERGRVARVDERIANAEALAGLASSEAGSEMGPKELARQIRLNELLLANLVKARKLARSGLGLTRWPKGMSVDKRTEGLMKGLAGGFRSNLVDLTGLTGAGGRIFETKNIIDELKHTTGAGPAALDISGLRSVIEAARYGVFDGYFARGGNLKPGRWGIAGERGPEVVHGPSTVLSPRATQDVLAPKVEVHNEFDFDGLDLYVTTKVNGEIAKRERVNHRRGRQAVR